MSFLRANAPRLAVLLLAATLFACAQPARPSGRQLAQLASGFHFVRQALPDPAGATPQDVYALNPALGRIARFLGQLGASVAMGDLQGTGLASDVCHVDPRFQSVLISPVPGTGDRFQPFLLEPTGLPYDASHTLPMGCLFGDFNEDGLTDVLVYYWGRSPIIFLRKEDGADLGPPAFIPRELVAGGPEWYTNAVTTADLDGDGHVDLIVGNYYADGNHMVGTWPSSSTPALPNSWSRANDGGGVQFLLWTGASADRAEFGLVPNPLPEDLQHRFTLALGAADLDGDLLPEIYVADDFGPDFLLHNESRPGQLRFRPLAGRGSLTTPGSKILGNDSFKGMGVDFGDLTGHGLLDIFVSNITAPFALQESNFVFVNDGQPKAMQAGSAPFTDRSTDLGLSQSGFAWDAKLADFANSGRLDVIQATGLMDGAKIRWADTQELMTTNEAMLNDPRAWPNYGDADLARHDHVVFFVPGAGGHFEDVGRQLGLIEPAPSRGIAVADVDGDGLLDFAVANQWGASGFYRNESPNPGRSLDVRLLLPLDPNQSPQTTVADGHVALRGRPAIGASVTLHRPDGQLTPSFVDGGSGHSGRRSPDVHFGLGAIPADTSLQVDVRWRDPAGTVRSETLALRPGWHTVMLGWPAGAANGR